MINCCRPILQGDVRQLLADDTDAKDRKKVNKEALQLSSRVLHTEQGSNYLAL